MDDETRQAFAELKAAIAELSGTLTARMNDQHERLLNRMTAFETDLRNMRSEHGVTREMVSSLPGAVLRAIEQPLLQRITKIENRLDDLERKP